MEYNGSTTHSKTFSRSLSTRIPLLPVSIHPVCPTISTSYIPLIIMFQKRCFHTTHKNVLLMNLIFLNHHLIKRSSFLILSHCIQQTICGSFAACCQSHTHSQNTRATFFIWISKRCSRSTTRKEAETKSIPKIGFNWWKPITQHNKRTGITS